MLDWLKNLPGEVANQVVVPVLAVLVLAALAVVGAFLLDTSVGLWAVVVALLAGLVVGALVGRRSRSGRGVGPYDTYVEHVRDALGDLRRVIRGELPSFSLREFIEAGVFQPAHRLLTASGDRGDVRFSVLHPDGTDFVMGDVSGGFFAAFGHRASSRLAFRIPIAGSFSQLAFTRNRVYWSNNLSGDDRFQPHDEADPERAYESIVSVPLRAGGVDGIPGGVDGVLNVIATEKNAFSAVDRTYISLLGSVIDVARAAEALR